MYIDYSFRHWEKFLGVVRRNLGNGVTNFFFLPSPPPPPGVEASKFLQEFLSPRISDASRASCAQRLNKFELMNPIHYARADEQLMDVRTFPLNLLLAIEFHAMMQLSRDCGRLIRKQASVI